MQRRTRWIITGVVAGVLAGGTGGGVAMASGATDTDRPITGSARTDAARAALAHTGGGRVTETETGDEESYYEVEVTMPDGRPVDVQLDERLAVVASSVDDDRGER